MKKIDYLSTLFVGIDIGSRTNVVSAIDFDQEYLIKAQSVSNAKDGAMELERLIVDVLISHQYFKKVLIGLESTGMYGVHIANYLSTSDKLKPFGTLVYCLNPKVINAYKKTYVSKAKNDSIDSFMIADYLRSGRNDVTHWRGAQYLALQRLTRHRLHISECIAREKIYMLNNIFLKFSELAFASSQEKHPLSNLYGATAEAILTEYKSTEDLVDAELAELIGFVASKSRSRLADPSQTAELLQKAARDSYRLDKCLYEPLTISISCSFNCLRALERERKALDVAIKQTIKGLNPAEYQILLSVPGIGEVYAAGILAEIGSIDCFSSNDKLAKYAGIVWNDNQSSLFEAEDVPMSKAGNRYLRYYLVEAAGSVIRHCPEYGRYYEKKFAEVTTHQHKRALALTSRKLIRMLYGLLAAGKLYSPGESRR